VSPPPASPRIYHITHVDNLPAIVAHGCLISDAAMIARGGPKAPIGMSNIKKRRLSLAVSGHAGLKVGDCVPFYFCPRSIMLYVIHCANHAELTYRGGQGPIVHLEADLHAVVGWAKGQQRRWAFSLSNAGASYAQFRSSLNDLGDIDWDAVASNNFSSGSSTPSGLPVKEGKQAEFLLDGDFPWSLVQRIGVASQAVAQAARAAVATATHQPQVSVQPSWYY
jgi:hypothetical protein